MLGSYPTLHSHSHRPTLPDTFITNPLLHYLRDVIYDCSMTSSECIFSCKRLILLLSYLTFVLKGVIDLLSRHSQSIDPKQDARGVEELQVCPAARGLWAGRIWLPAEGAGARSQASYGHSENKLVDSCWKTDTSCSCVMGLYIGPGFETSALMVGDWLQLAST